MTLFLVFGLVLAAAVGVIWVVNSVVVTRRSNPIIDLDVQEKAAGFISSAPQLHAALGKTGLAATDLRPQGFITIDERRFDAQTEGGEFFERGTPVLVCGLSGQFLVVRRHTPPALSAQTAISA